MVIQLQNLLTELTTLLMLLSASLNPAPSTSPVLILGGGIEPIAKEIVFNGTIIKTAYTDENIGESLIIRTDKSTYGGWDSASVYFSIENTGLIDETANINFLFQGDEKVKSINQLVKNASYQVEVSDYGQKDFLCDSDWKETIVSDERGDTIIYVCDSPVQSLSCDSIRDNTCIQNNAYLGSHFETRYKDEWQGLPLSKANSVLTTKPAPVKFKLKDKATYLIPTGQTKYFKADIEFSPKKPSTEFYIQAVNSDGTKFGLLDPWWDSNYLNRVKITFSGATTTAGANLTNFPILVNLNPTRVNYATASSGVSTNIRFVDDDDSTELNYEIEKWDSSATSTIWVKVPDVATSTTDYIYMYYNNPSATENSSSSGVWDSNFAGVWHLNQTTTSTSPWYGDSTVNLNNGSSTGTSWPTPTSTLSLLDGSQSFDGGGDWIDLSNNDTVGGASAATISAWVNITNTAAARAIYDETWNGLTASRLYFEYNTDDTIRCGGRSQSGDTFQSKSTTLAGPQGSWTHVVCILDIANDDIKIYSNGSQPAVTGTPSWTPTSFSATTPCNQSIGGSAAIGCASILKPFNGLIDEVRISSSSRSAAWIEGEYKNGVDIYNTYGAEEDVPSVSVPIRKRIIIIE